MQSENESLWVRYSSCLNYNVMSRSALRPYKAFPCTSDAYLECLWLFYIYIYRIHIKIVCVCVFVCLYMCVCVCVVFCVCVLLLLIIYWFFLITRFLLRWRSKDNKLINFVTVREGHNYHYVFSWLQIDKNRSQ